MYWQCWKRGIASRIAFAALLAAAALGAASNSASSEVAYCWVDAAAAQTQSAAVTNLFAVPADAGPPAPAIVDPSNPNRALDPTNGRTFVRIPCPTAAAMRTSNGYVDDGFAGLGKSGTATSDLGNPATGAFDANRFEVRGGFFAHGVGSVEKILTTSTWNW